MSSRIDWRNYDYSEGPPKASSPTNVPHSTSSIGSNQTRDTNPYSKSFNIRRSSPTHEYDNLSLSHASLSQKSAASAEVSKITGQPKLTYRPSTSTPSPTFVNSVSPVVMDTFKPPKIVVKHDSYEDIPLKTNVKKSLTPTTHEKTERMEEDFNDVWDQAESEWKEAESIQRVISDDEDEVEDGHFIGGGSIASSPKMNLTSSPPVGILRNKSDPSSPAMMAVDEEGSYSSSKRRKHPWDKDYDDGNNDVKEAPMDERSLDSKAEEEDDSTNLQRYEAHEKDVADIEDDDAVILKHEQYKMQQQLLQQKQLREQKQQLLQQSYDDDVNADAIASINRRRMPRNSENEFVDEEDSIAHVYGNVNDDVAVGLLQDRAKQAWSKRNQVTAVSSPVGRNNNVSHTMAQSNRPTQGKDSKRALVSFQKDTVHEFAPDEDEEEEEDSYESEEVTEYTEDDTHYDDDTYAGRSLHSVYTKSYESEAEDLVKDLFLWGSGKATNPGRRELKYKNGYKEKYKQAKKKVVEDTDDDAIKDEHTIEDESTLEGSSLVSNNHKSFSRQRDEDDGTYDGSKATYESLTYSEMGEDACAITYNYCEDLLTMIGSVCGIGSVTASKVVSEPKQVQSPITSTTETKTVTTTETTGESDIQTKLENWLGYAAELLFDTEPTDRFSGMDQRTKQALMTLATNAARTKHQLKNCTFIDANSLDLNRDIKIVNIRVGLPIGIVFEESPVSCWVKRIFPNGNAAKRSSGGKLEEGDQLASINGNSAIQKNVAEVCKLLANTPNPDAIELCFIRYIGAIQTAPENQGYEVIDPKINGAKTSSAPASAPISVAKKFSFGRSKSASPSIENQMNMKKSNSAFSFGKNKQNKGNNISPSSSSAPQEKKKKKLFGFLRKKKN